MAMIEDNEEKLLRSVALQTSTVILQARLRAEHELQSGQKGVGGKGKAARSLFVDPARHD